MTPYIPTTMVQVQAARPTAAAPRADSTTNVPSPAGSRVSVQVARRGPNGGRFGPPEVLQRRVVDRLRLFWHVGPGNGRWVSPALFSRLARASVRRLVSGLVVAQAPLALSGQ